MPETTETPDAFTVTMLGVLLEPLRQWLATQGLVAMRMPGPDHNTYVVVPAHLPWSLDE